MARWMELVPESGIQRTRSLLKTSAHYQDLTPTQYETALAWLEPRGLLRGPLLASPYASVVVFEHLVGEAGWFANADVLVREPDELPLDAAIAAQELGLDPGEAAQVIRTQWGKVDTARREEIGAAGELALLALLRSSLVRGATVEHVAAVSDGLGYDIAVEAPGLECHIEVKSTTGRPASSFFLSRNEYEVSRFDRRWILALVQLSPTLELQQVEEVNGAWLRAAAPVDKSPAVQWQSARFEAPSNVRVLGLAQLEELLVGPGLLSPR